MAQEARDLTVRQAFDLGVQFAGNGDHRSAIGLFRAVLEHEPENFDAIERLGGVLFALKQYHEALYWFWRGRKIRRREPMALTNYGLTVSQLGHWEEGLAELRKAAHIAEREKMPPHVLAVCYNNIGNTLERMGRHAEALTALDKGISSNPNDAFPYYNRGIVLLRLNRQHEALASLDRAIAMNPSDHDARYNRGVARLLLGDFKRGFADYEARLLTPDNKAVNMGLPAEKKWTGGDLTGRTLLVTCEQGIGDTIQFMRFLPQLMARNPAHVSLVAHTAIASMVEPSARLTLIKSGQEFQPGLFDYWVAIMSLPFFLGVDDESKIPPPWQPKIEPERFERWRTGLALSDRALNIGVCWAGNWRHKNDHHRSIPLDKFARLFKADGCNFVSLQQVRQEDEDLFKKMQVDHGLRFTALKDMRDTAAIMLNLDMVISVDTAVAHLAATLGVPTKIMIPAFGTDWRWQLGRTDSPWYPNATLYRQPKIGDWDSVIAQLRDEISKYAQQSAA